MGGNQAVRDSRSQPASKAEPQTANARSRNFRRAGLSDFIATLRCVYPITAGNHRAQMVPEAADDDFEYMDQNKGHQYPCHQKMDGAPRLPPAKQIDPAG